MRAGAIRFHGNRYCYTRLAASAYAHGKRCDCPPRSRSPHAAVCKHVQPHTAVVLSRITPLFFRTRTLNPAPTRPRDHPGNDAGDPSLSWRRAQGFFSRGVGYPPRYRRRHRGFRGGWRRRREYGISGGGGGGGRRAWRRRHGFAGEGKRLSSVCCCCCCYSTVVTSVWVGMAPSLSFMGLILGRGTGLVQNGPQYVWLRVSPGDPTSWLVELGLQLSTC